MNGEGRRTQRRPRTTRDEVVRDEADLRTKRIGVSEQRRCRKTSSSDMDKATTDESMVVQDNDDDKFTEYLCTRNDDCQMWHNHNRKTR